MVLFNNKKVQQGNSSNAYNGGAAFFQPKLVINQPGDHYEQEADAMADKVMRMHDGGDVSQNFFKPPLTPIQRKCQQCEEEEHIVRRKESDAETQTVTGQTENYIGGLNGSGRPLSQSEKSFFEPRFGYDFTGVQLHTGTEANQSAQSINALAYTHGSNIVFGEGQYQPGTDAGNRLMAHELTHVVQQSGNTQTAVQRKPAYEVEADNLLAATNKKTIKFSGGSKQEADELPVVKKYVAFVEAVVKEDKKAIPGLLTDFLKSNPSIIPGVSPIDRGNMAEIITKLIALGLGDDAARLEQFFPTFEKAKDSTIKGFGFKEFLWQSIEEKMPDPFQIKDPIKAGDAADAWLLFIKQLIAEVATLDPKAIAKDKAANKSGGDHTIGDYLTTLNQTIIASFMKFQVVYQVVFEKALGDLENNKGDAFLKTAKQKLDALSKIQLTNELLTTKIDTSKTNAVSTGGKFLSGSYVDYFMDAKGPKPRTVDIEFYNVDVVSKPAEKSSSLQRIFDIRLNQIDVLENLYGFKKDNKGVLTAETKENAAAIKQAGGLSLEDNDSWRQFLFAKYDANKAANGGDKKKAYQETIELIRQYMSAFTVHTPDNIIDGKLNELQIHYPRTLTGQLIHDCGVYALRTTFMLSLLRNHDGLGLSFRFIRLPQHTSLIITGNGVPTYFVQNNQFLFFEASDMADSRKRWDDTTVDQGKKLPVTDNEKEEAENEFLGEMAADLYINGADQPYRMQTMTDTITEASLWKFFMNQVVPDVFGVDRSGDYHTIIDMFKEFHNMYFVPFWNGFVFKNWPVAKPKLKVEQEKMAKAATAKERDAAKAEFNRLFTDYKKAVFAGFTPLLEKFAKVKNKVEELNKEMGATKGLTAANAKMSNSARQAAMLGEWIFQQKEKAIKNDLTMEFDPRETKAEALD